MTRPLLELEIRIPDVHPRCFLYAPRWIYKLAYPLGITTVVCISRPLLALEIRISVEYPNCFLNFTPLARIGNSRFVAFDKRLLHFASFAGTQNL